MLIPMFDRLQDVIKRIPQPLRYIVNVALCLVLLAITILFEMVVPIVAAYAVILGVLLIFLASGAFWTFRLVFRGIQRVRRSRFCHPDSI